MEAELLDSPEEREPVGSSKNRRDFGTCQVKSLLPPTGALYVMMLHYNIIDTAAARHVFEIFTQPKYIAKCNISDPPGRLL